jgi:hypothetical protein
MKTYSQLVEDLSKQLRDDMPEVFKGGFEDQSARVAHWILMKYKPPMEWEEIAPSEYSYYKWDIILRTMVAGKFLEFKGYMSDEARKREPQMIDKLRDSIRLGVGRAMVNFIDNGEEPKPDVLH